MFTTNSQVVFRGTAVMGQLQYLVQFSQIIIMGYQIDLTT